MAGRLTKQEAIERATRLRDVREAVDNQKRHGPVDMEIGQIPDADGNIGAPAGRKLDTIAILVGKGKMTAQQESAARIFEKQWQLASLDGTVLSRSGPPIRGGQFPGARLERPSHARGKIWAAVAAMNGWEDDRTRVVIRVCALGMSLQEVGKKLRIPYKCVSPYLVCGLNDLAAHYGLVATVKRRIRSRT